MCKTPCRIPVASGFIYTGYDSIQSIPRPIKASLFSKETGNRWHGSFLRNLLRYNSGVIKRTYLKMLRYSMAYSLLKSLYPHLRILSFIHGPLGSTHLVASYILLSTSLSLNLHTISLY